MLYFSCLTHQQFCDIHNSIATAGQLPSLLSVFFGTASISPLVFTFRTWIFHIKRKPFTYDIFKFLWKEKHQSLGGGGNLKVTRWCHGMLWRPFVVFSIFLKLSSFSSDGSSTHRGVEGKSHRCILKCVIAGMRMCLSFREHVFSLCLAVCVLLSLKGGAESVKDRSPGWCPREAGNRRHCSSVPSQQCPSRARGTSSMGRQEWQCPVLILPAPTWQTALLAAKPLGAASDWISQPGKSSKKGKRVKTEIGKTCQMAARKPSAASRPEASRVWAQRSLTRGN